MKKNVYDHSHPSAVKHFGAILDLRIGDAETDVRTEDDDVPVSSSLSLFDDEVFWD